MKGPLSVLAICLPPRLRIGRIWELLGARRYCSAVTADEQREEANGGIQWRVPDPSRQRTRRQGLRGCVHGGAHEGVRGAANYVGSYSGDLGPAEDSDGQFMLVWFEAPEIEKVLTDLATAGDEFSTWFRGQVKDRTGVDLGAPPESPPPDVLVDWTA
jgi:hypothetical protein